MAEKELLQKFLVAEEKKTHDSTNKILDELRRTRKARGGVGAPLEVPAHLRGVTDGSGLILVTDAELDKDGRAEKES